MKSFSYTIRDEQGMHARPAGLLVKLAAGFSSSVKLEKEGKAADGKRLFAVMGLAAQKGDTLQVTVEGTDEEAAAAALEEFMKGNL